MVHPVRSRVAAAASLAVAAVAMLALSAPAHADSYTKPDVNAPFDYQLGGAYTPQSGVKVLSRDRTEKPQAGLYNICYVNLMQTQEDDGSSSSNPTYGTTAWWKKNHPELLLKNSAGKVIIDADWNEALFDVRTAATRSALAAIQKPWIQKCKTDGFQAVEPDNIDSETRSKGLMTHQNIRDYLKVIVPYTHSVGLAIAQKNALSSDAGAEWTTDGPTFVDTVSPRQGFDFAIVEECQQYSECGGYMTEYSNRVFEIEYTKARFTSACSARGAQISIVYRDVDVTKNGPYAAC